MYRGAMNGSHENLVRKDHLKPGSERSFGLVMATAFCVLAAFAAWSGLALRASGFFVLAAAFGGLALVAPAALAPLNRLWFRFGLLLHKLVSPLVLGLLFFAEITPIGLLMGLLGKRPLPLHLDRSASSYWTSRGVASPAPGSMRKQY